MVAKLGRTALMFGAAAYLAAAMPAAGLPAGAQDERRGDWHGDGGWDRPRCDWREGRDRIRCERDQGRWEREREDRWRREADRKRRDDDRAKGVAAGVIGTALVGGLIVALASDSKKKKKARERERYCIERYGNYDERSDTYRDRDGRSYPCT